MPPDLSEPWLFMSYVHRWCKREKRAFLRQRIEFRLAGLYLDALDYNASTKLINPLLREVKRIDDKALLIEIQLLEARVHHAVKNLSKTRASLTSARTTANAIYVPPLLQAEIDMMAGILSAEEKDYKTAYSYFYEAFEGFNTMDDPRFVHTYCAPP
jgi:26S proteasome regulatory subunit N6